MYLINVAIVDISKNVIGVVDVFHIKIVATDVLGNSVVVVDVSEDVIMFVNVFKDKVLAPILFCRLCNSR